MNLVAVSVKGWQASAISVAVILNTLAKKEEITTTILDYQTIIKHKTEIDNASNNLVIYKFSKNQKNLQLFAKKLLSDEIVVIDATGVSLHSVISFLNSARKIWFHLDEWQSIFAIIYDDFNLIEIAQEMSTTFYSMPQFISDYEVKQMTKKIVLNAKILKLFGPSIVLNLLHKFNFLKSKLLNNFRANF